MARVRTPAPSALRRAQNRSVRRELDAFAGRELAAREMHDEVIQQLFGIGLAMQITRRRVKSPPVASRLAEHIDEIEGVIKEFRAVITEALVRPAADPGLYAALSQIFAMDATRRTAAALSSVRRRGRRRGSTRPGGAAAPVSGSTREARLVEAFVTLADTLVAGHDLVELMHHLVDVCAELLDAAAAGLVLADGHGQLDVLASTSERTELLEILQIRTGRGPCWDCVSTGSVQSITDVMGEMQRWPEFAPLALGQGFRSVHAVPLRLRAKTFGALNLFRTTPGELAEADRRVAQALADVATIGVLQERSARESAELNLQLERAMASRVVIEQAKGVLAQFGGLDMDQALAELRGHARRHRIALTELAQGVVDRRYRPDDILHAGHLRRPILPER